MRFLTGPAGSGKTFRCLQEIREQLARAPEGSPLLLVAPKQATYELERQLLSSPLPASSLAAPSPGALPRSPVIQGYTRLQILSFERLADFIFDQCRLPTPELLSEEGRVMVLRGLLARKRKGLRLFRASARLTGFASQLSSAISEFQQSRLTPEQLREVAGKMQGSTLGLKLQDLAEITDQYFAWLGAHGLADSEHLLEYAAASLKELGSGKESNARPTPDLRWSLYVDGFPEISEAELELLASLVPYCVRATVSFCLPDPLFSESKARSGAGSWLSEWSLARRCLESCRKRLAAVPEAELIWEHVSRDAARSRFSKSQALRALELRWAQRNFGIPGRARQDPRSAIEGLRVVQCANPEAEVIFAAREIRRFVRQGGRFQQVAVLVRDLEKYHHVFQRVFACYEIPLFLDRRESVSHHPLVELTRSALRTVAFGWQHEDWFAALKTGLVPAREHEIDQLENEALARGWEGPDWQTRLLIRELRSAVMDHSLAAAGAEQSAPSRPGAPGSRARETDRLARLEDELEATRAKVVPPFQNLALALKQAQSKPSGQQLASAIRDFWAALAVTGQLERWALAQRNAGPARTGAAQVDQAALHRTVWVEINGWLDNLEVAFREDRLPLREWLPIAEAGLGSLTVGLIPPALDQVLVGTVDRSRNPDIAFGLVLGMNETVFPASPSPTILLTLADRAELERHGAKLGLDARQQLNRERYYAYVACTRPREQLLLTYAGRGEDGAPLNPSPFLHTVCELVPEVAFEVAPEQWGLQDCEHPNELFAATRALHPADRDEVAGFWNVAGRLAVNCGELKSPVQGSEERLSPEMAEQLYGPVLRTSVSRMENFAACPFKFFVQSGLRAEERKLFELDVREQGTFQHDVLALFHDQLVTEGKRWRDVTPAEARGRIAASANAVAASFREGLLQANAQTRFMTRAMTESLQDFIEVVVTWMRQQYRFDPHLVEVPFGENEAQPAWTLDLGGGHQLQVYGRIDRVDLFRRPGTDEVLCVVIDYKSSQKQLDPLLMANGLQIQLLTYLNVLRDWPNPAALFGGSQLIPAGVFYVSLRGKYGSEKNRTEALNEPEQSRKQAYRHFGRFDSAVIPHLDARAGVRKGDQFNFRLSVDGTVHKTCREAMTNREFLRLLDSMKLRLAEMGRQIYAGTTAVAPFRKGSKTACQQCVYQWICRIDPWIHHYRVLTQPQNSAQNVHTELP